MRDFNNDAAHAVSLSTVNEKGGLKAAVSH